MLHRICRALRAAPLLALALGAACDDLPTGPQVWTREAAGRRWVAVAEPAGLPSARGWLHWTSPAEGDSVRGLLTTAARERRAGRMEVALRIEEDAGELAAGALARVPEAVLFMDATDAVEAWAERAAAPAATGRFPELARDVGHVRELAAAARARLASGDSLAAAGHLTRAANLARRWTPMGVASRAVAQAEASIAADPNPSPELVRAARLLRGAREGVAEGDHARALQRATYALQLIEHARRR